MKAKYFLSYTVVVALFSLISFSCSEEATTSPIKAEASFTAAAKGTGIYDRYRYMYIYRRFLFLLLLQKEQESTIDIHIPLHQLLQMLLDTYGNLVMEKHLLMLQPLTLTLMLVIIL